VKIFPRKSLTTLGRSVIIGPSDKTSLEKKMDDEFKGADYFVLYSFIEGKCLPKRYFYCEHNAYKARDEFRRNNPDGYAVVDYINVKYEDAPKT
jgi:hypothetical protein